MVKVTIQHGKLLEPFFNFYVKNSPDVKGSGWKDWVPPDKEKIEERIKSYKEIWGKYEEKVLNGISSALGLTFKEDVDVYVVAGINRDMSNPMIISSHKGPKNFLVALTHELIHRLLASNKDSFNINNDFLFVKGNNATVNSHILVFSVLRQIFKEDLEILKVVSNLTGNDYKKAYGLSEPYEDILKFFRDKLRPL